MHGRTVGGVAGGQEVVGMGLEVQVALIGLIGAIVGGGIASLTALLTSRSERKKFARERLWDQRREGYSKIISSLVTATNIATHMDEEYSDDPHGYDASERSRQAMAEYIAHMHSARDALNAYRLVLSASFVEIYETAQRQLEAEAGNPNLVPPEGAEITGTIMKTALTHWSRRSASYRKEA